MISIKVTLVLLWAKKTFPLVTKSNVIIVLVLLSVAVSPKSKDNIIEEGRINFLKLTFTTLRKRI